jgi:hypothetical protein
MRLERERMPVAFVHEPGEEPPPPVAPSVAGTLDDEEEEGLEQPEATGLSTPP